jgi:hypothetical protein
VAVLTRRQKISKFGFSSLPNLGEKSQTPATLMIDTHYAQLRLLDRWTWERYCRLCEYLRMTAYEMASVVMLPHANVSIFRTHGRIPNPGATHIALLLTMIEYNMCKGIAIDAVDPFDGVMGGKS